MSTVKPCVTPRDVIGYLGFQDGVQLTVFGQNIRLMRKILECLLQDFEHSNESFNNETFKRKQKLLLHAIAF